MSPTIRVFLCDDVPELRALLRYGLEEDEQLEVVGEAGTAEDAIAAVGELLPDVVLLDLSMPGMDGLEAIPRLLEVAPGTSIVVFSGFAAARMRAPALELGAARYVEKGEPLETVRATVREVVGA
ncbi:MAG: response regulator transcription factor [Solirubrobacterales bacterium]|nr:response regulator transcription factor [Solirubrobacterales bacterium]